MTQPVLASVNPVRKLAARRFDNEEAVESATLSTTTSIWLTGSTILIQPPPAPSDSSADACSPLPLSPIAGTTTRPTCLAPPTPPIRRPGRARPAHASRRHARCHVGAQRRLRCAAGGDAVVANCGRRNKAADAPGNAVEAPFVVAERQYLHRHCGAGGAGRPRRRYWGLCTPPPSPDTAITWPTLAWLDASRCLEDWSRVTNAAGRMHGRASKTSRIVAGKAPLVVPSSRCELRRVCLQGARFVWPEACVVRAEGRIKDVPD
ncbi:hypothetical protein EJ06DRAFT_84266 [Trichodelitschia bisporula]|uniref:Uncharacterized protein n=1 Tax=Trichodelitschia bisporula TaxID=703511 RepID=A0A6G1HS56_9PEZI|nr:hypothetical protein EJ06DRAFT_84266 [Trichodelitschia bisporula]